MLSLLLNFSLGLILLLLCTNSLVKYSIKLAHKLKLSPLVIGVTLVAMGTSLPELVVSVLASINGDYGLAFGNIVGSNISNVLLVLPVGILIGKLRIGTTKTQRNYIILAIATLIFFSLRIFEAPPVVAAFILITLGVTFTFVEYRWGIKGSELEDRRTLLVFHHKSAHVKFTLSDIFHLTAAIIGITIGGMALVVATEGLSSILGYSTTVLGLSLTAVATSLPELLTTIFSQEEHDEKLTIGNIQGSNIYNILIIGGFTSAFMLTRRIIFLTLDEWLWLIGSTVMLGGVIVLFKGRVVPRAISLLYLACFAAYIFTLSSYK